MILNELFKKSKKIVEGGNLELPNPQDPAQPHQAQDIELKIHNRSYMVGILDKLMNDINNTFSSRYKKTLWSPELLKNRTFLSGSSLHFFDVKNIPDEVFVAKKPKVGDIDTQCDVTQEPQVGEFLKSIQGQKIGNSTFIGFKPGNNQFSSLWALDEPPVKIQIDFEFGRYDPETNAPDEWYAYSHSSAWEDVEAGIKGVFHKYINRALTGVSSTEKYVARVLKKGVKISPEPVTDNDLSFAVSGGQGGGMSRKYKPYVDPTTGEPQVINGIPVMQLLDPKDRDYVQNLGQQFELIYGRKPSAQDRQLMNSFVGTIQLANKYLDDQGRESVANAFIDICFEPGSQMINKDDPARDREVKFAAIDFMVENMKLANAASTRKHAIAMSKAYEDAYRAKKGTTPLAEAEVKAQLRKGMPHLRELKPADLLDLIDEIHDGNGQFKLQNIPLNVKVDGFGGRFGKNADGKPFMGTSRTEPRYEPGFVAYHQQKGTTDPEVLGRAQLFDQLFEEMMNAVKLVDSKLGPDFLVNKQVTCEVLYLPFATETPEGRLKFVGIHYDKLPEGVKLALVPFRVTDASTGEDLPDSNQIVKDLTSAGQMGSVMFINNSLTQNEALDVTALVPPVENIEQIKSMLASGKLAQKREAKELLAPVALALEKAIINDPNIIGKDMLGKDYEGIVINSRLGPIKVTSQEQRDVISAKNAAKANARTERPRENTNKTAVVAIGSFVGHVGHEQLFDYTVKKAAEVGGDPYLFIGNAVGKDDPIPPDVKVQTWHKLYPEYSKNISTVAAGGSLMQKIKHELINPLPGKPPRYDNVIIMVGEDQASMPIANALMKAVNKFQGYEHVKVSLEVTPRGTGMSFSKLRNILKDPNATEQQQFALWSQAFDVNKLGAGWIKHLMDITRKGMGIQQQTPAPVAAPVAETRLLNALIRPTLVNELDVSKTLNFATKAHKGQQYGEKPYITHPRSVAATGKKFFGAAFTPDAIKVALLHDVVEDTPYKLQQLSKMGYSPEVVQAVQLLTKNKALSYADNIRAIIASGNKLAMMVKYADNYQNFTGDKSSWDPARAAHSQKKYLASLDMLGDKLGIKQHLSQPEIAEAEGDATGLKHISKKLLQHIVQQVGTEGAHAIVKSLQYGDGAAKELLQLITQDLKQDIAGMKEQGMAQEDHTTATGGWGQGAYDTYSKGNHGHGVAEGEICKHCQADPCICDDSHGFVNEERMSAAVRMQRAADRQRAKSDASLRRTPSSIPKAEPKKDVKTNEEGGVGVIASKKQAKDPRYSTSLTVDVRPGQVNKNLKAFNLAEKMMPASNFTGSKKNKLGPAGQWKNTGPKKNKPAQAGDLVGGMEESLKDSNPCWKGYHPVGTKKKSGKTVPNCVPVSENVENIMDSLINKIVVNEAIRNKK